MAKNFWIVDTFSKSAFQGTSSAVFFVDCFDDELLLQNVAMELNAPETIFIKDLQNGDFESICFSPKSKGLFFGNGLFAAAKVINQKTELRQFNIICGIRIFAIDISDEGGIDVRFSTVELNKVSTPINLHVALDDELIVSLAECKDELIIEIRSPKRLMNLTPNMDILANINYNSFIITADTHYETDLDYDFCAKVFAPRLGVFRDIATPISCAKLAAYWSSRIEKTNLKAFIGSGQNIGNANIDYGSEFTHVSGDCVISTIGEMLAF